MSSFSVSSVPVMVSNQHTSFNSKLRSANFASSIWHHTFSLIMCSSQHAPSNSKRRSANYAPNIWHDTFLKYANSAESLEINEIMKQEVQMHKEKAAKIYLFSNDNNISQKLSLIDSTQRLGISYYFENEIDKILTQIYNDFTNNNLTIEEGDLHFTALLFRLLRQKGYYISSDIFNKSKNGKGEFDELLVQDVKGIWSLYEAAQLRIHGEEILEEAHEFTYNKLKSIANQLGPSLADQINQSLIQPLHKAIARMRARSYMFFYEEDPSPHNKILLNFAKLEFNMIQKLYQQEVGVAVRWWKKSEFATKFPYARERIAELYFWPFSMNSEPKYSSFRRITAKLVQWMTVVDDTYDVYGTIGELELFTQAIQRWDIGCIASLPECYEAIFNAMVELFDEIIELLNAVDGELNLVLQFLKKAVRYIYIYIKIIILCFIATFQFIH
ncbi:hypothetical protein PIB30_049299 [Stylosanthes scabra]|uniref:Uncharacterized protein n=1 Tax=Stylosanthes scabra TaxID=79078 RepID=A0ABU6RHF9_9FABA|nr:hypothetical protein [Stylosanthes scabra]